MLKLLLVRHAQSAGNSQGRMEGQTSTPLSSLGWQQAACLGRRLRQEDWLPSQIYCSPLLRATQTLVGVASGFGWQLQESSLSELAVPIALDEGLMEYNNGLLAGLTWEEAQQRYPDLCSQLLSQADWLPIPGAESLLAGRGRAVRFWQRLLEQHHNGDRIWIISHHWLLQQLISVMMGCDRTWGMAIAHTGCFEFWLDCDRWRQLDENRWNSELWQLKRFNDCQHLTG